MTEAVPAAPAPVNPAPGAAPRGRYVQCNLAALAVAVAAAVPALLAPTKASPDAPGSGFLAPSWDDGQAEVCRYDAEREIYKQPRPFELVQVVVKEPYDPATRTKPAAPRPGTVDALKLVRIEDAPSGRLYRYRQTLTLRVDRRDPWRLLDAACGSQEWCGNTFALLAPRGPALVKHVHSYFDGEGDREEAFAAGTLLEDQLLVALRARPVDRSIERSLPLLGSLVANKHPAAVPVVARIRVEADETVPTGAGALACGHVKVERDGLPSLEFWIGREAPHVLARWKHGDGRQGTLRSIERTIYWRDP